MAEVGEAALFLDLRHESRVPCNAGATAELASVSAKLAKHFCPLKVGSYWLALAENALCRKDQPGFRAAMTGAKRYASYFDRGLAGIRYNYMRGIWLGQRKKKQEAAASSGKAKTLVEGIRAGINDEVFARAFGALDMVRWVMAQSQSPY